MKNEQELPADPSQKYPQPPFPKQDQNAPGVEGKLQPGADHGEESYKGSGKLTGKKAIITGGDSGIGRAVAIAYAREGADVLIAYLDDSEDEDARNTADLVEAAGRKAILMKGDIQNEKHCIAIIDRAVNELEAASLIPHRLTPIRQTNSFWPMQQRKVPFRILQQTSVRFC